MTKREKQLKLLRSQIKRQEQNRELGIKLLVRATLELPKLRKAEARLETAVGRRTVQTVQTVQMQPEVTVTEILAPLKEADTRADMDDSLPDKVPEFLRRGMAAQKAVDGVISEEAKRLAALPDPKTKEKKAEQRAIEKEVREAKLRGQTKKWPATGKAAVAAIRARPSAT